MRCGVQGYGVRDAGCGCAVRAARARGADVGAVWDDSNVTSNGVDDSAVVAAAGVLAVLDVPGLIMRVRRACDLSQRELARAVGLQQSQVARMESARTRVDLPMLAGMLALAGYRIAVLDRHGVEVAPVPADVLRDNAGRRMPAHLDVRTSTEVPEAALVHTHPDRPNPRARYHHRPQRDRRRAGRWPGGEPDQLTSSGLARLEQSRRVERRRVVQQRAAALLTTDCVCRDECWTRGRCTDVCTCRCE